MPNVGLSLPPNAYGFGSQFRTCSLSDSMNQLAERLAADGVIFEEGNGDYAKHYPTYYPDQYREHSSTARRYKKGSENGLMFRPCSTTALNHTGVVHVSLIFQKFSKTQKMQKVLVGIESAQFFVPFFNRWNRTRANNMIFQRLSHWAMLTQIFAIYQ
jgi:hypothetical protein